jgi:hypothetical protein
MCVSDCEDGKRLLEAATQPYAGSVAREANSCSLLSKVLHLWWLQNKPTYSFQGTSGNSWPHQIGRALASSHCEGIPRT